MKNIIETIFADYYLLEPKIKKLPNLTDTKFEDSNLSKIYKQSVNDFLSQDKEISNILKISTEDFDTDNDMIVFDVKQNSKNNYVPQHITLAFSEAEKEYKIIEIEYSNDISNLSLIIDDKDTLCITLNNDGNYLKFKIKHLQDITFVVDGDKVEHFKEEYNTTEKAINFIEHLLLKPYNTEQKDLQILHYDSVIDSIGFSDSITTLNDIIESNTAQVKPRNKI